MTHRYRKFSFLQTSEMASLSNFRLQNVKTQITDIWPKKAKRYVICEGVSETVSDTHFKEKLSFSK